MRVSPLFLALLFCLPALPQAPDQTQTVVGRLMAQPPLSPEEVAAAEARLVTNPENLNLRMRLLTQYRDMAPVPPNDDPLKRQARLRHIAYFVEHNPNVLDPTSPLLYVARSGRPYANEADHAIVRGLWMRLADTNPADTRLVLNAAWFLFVEDKREAEDLLKRAVEREPGNQRIAANLGFLYGMQILGVDGFAMDSTGTASPERAEAKQFAIEELENSSNAAVLAGAAAAIPNLAVRASRGTQVDPEIFQLSSKLMASARTLAPNDEAFRGPMPMIEYFHEQIVQCGRQPMPMIEHSSEAQRLPNNGIANVPPPLFDRTRSPNEPTNVVLASPPSESIAGSPNVSAQPLRVRIGRTVQNAKLLQSPEPKYPDEARASGIAGDVRFDATIAQDGTIAALTLRSGHPLLVRAAIDAVKQWRYRPTLLNGTPTEVITEIVVSFPPKQ